MYVEYCEYLYTYMRIKSPFLSLYFINPKFVYLPYIIHTLQEVKLI